MVDRRDAYKVLVRRSGRKIPLGRPRRGWEDTTKTDVQKRGIRAWTGLI